MHGKTTDREFDMATHEFIKTFNAFKKAAKKLMAIMENITKKKDPQSGDHSIKDQRIYEFMIQIMNENSQISEGPFAIQCVANEEKGKES